MIIENAVPFETRCYNAFICSSADATSMILQSISENVFRAYELGNAFRAVILAPPPISIHVLETLKDLCPAFHFIKKNRFIFFRTPDLHSWSSYSVYSVFIHDDV